MCCKAKNHSEENVQELQGGQFGYRCELLMTYQSNNRKKKKQVWKNKNDERNRISVPLVGNFRFLESFPKCIYLTNRLHFVVVCLVLSELFYGIE